MFASQDVLIVVIIANIGLLHDGRMYSIGSNII